MTILERHIGFSIAAALGLSLLALVGIDSLVAVVDQLDDLQGDYGFAASLYYVMLTVPASLHDYLPFAALVGGVAGVGALAASGELVVIRTGGLSLLSLLWAIARPALLLGLVGLLLAEFLVPTSIRAAENFRAEAVNAAGDGAGEETSGLRDIAYGTWHRQGTQFIHFDGVYEDGRLVGVSIFDFGPDRSLLRSRHAQQAQFRGDHWELLQVREAVYGASFTTEERYERQPWPLQLSPRTLALLSLGPEALSLSDLAEYSRYLRHQGVDNTEYRLAWWQKLLQPLAMIALALLAVAAVLGPLREASMGARVFAGVMTGLAVQTLQNLLAPATLVFGFAPWLAGALPIALALTAATVLLWRRV